MKPEKSTSEKSSYQRFFDMNINELYVELILKYASIVKAKSLLFFETRLSFEISLFTSIERDNRIEMVNKMVEYISIEEKLNKLIDAYNLRNSFNLYVDDYEKWKKSNFPELKTSNSSNQDLKFASSHLRVV